MVNFIDDRTMSVGGDLNSLDLFVIDFVRIIEKYSKYVIVSGYISILFGRSRVTEDIDILAEKMNKTSNEKQRMNFVEFWAEYVKNHSDKDWRSQQEKLINSQINSKIKISPEDYLKIKSS